MQPYFSIITTSYNYGRFIGATIESVLRQSCDAWELIVVDDASSDDSWQVITRYTDDPRIKAVRFDRNRGACAAYNAALAMVTGEFIASLDSDDLFAETKLARQRQFLEENPEVDVCATWLAEIDRAGEPVPADALHYVPWFNTGVDLNDPANWVWQNRLCHSSSVVRRALHDQVGPFRDDLTFTPDWNFWLRALVAGARFAVIREPLTKYRNHGGNITHRSPAKTLLEYAETSATIWHPYLMQQGREDLVLRNIEGFLTHHGFHELERAQRQGLLDDVLGASADTNGMKFCSTAGVVELLLNQQEGCAQLAADRQRIQRELVQSYATCDEVRVQAREQEARAAAAMSELWAAEQELLLRGSELSNVESELARYKSEYAEFAADALRFRKLCALFPAPVRAWVRRAREAMRGKSEVQ